MKFLYALLIGTLLTGPAIALSQPLDLEGIVSKENNSLYFNVHKTKKRYKMAAANTFAGETLNTLNSGDRLECAGFINEKGTVFYVDSIHFVGLKEMIGVWKSERKVLYEFVSFDKVTLYEKPVVDRQNSGFEPIATYQYTITPSNSRDSWSIFINDDKTINTGNLKIHRNHLIIEMMNSDTGEVEKVHSLRRAF